MPKIAVSKVAEILKKNHLEPGVLRRVIEEMNLAVEPDPAGDDREPPVKKQFVILVSDPEGQLPGAEFAAWVLQIPESESQATTQDRVIAAAHNYNTTKKGHLYPVKTMGETIENVPVKFFREVDLIVKTKTPVIMLRTDNRIPKEIK